MMHRMSDESVLILACKAYENKLKELMTPEDYELFTKAVSVEIYRADVLSWKDGDFKQFCLEHIEELCADDFDAKEFHKKYPKFFNQTPWEAWGAPDPEEGDELEEV